MKISSLIVKDLKLSGTVMSTISDIQLSDIVDNYTLSNAFYMKSQTSSSTELSSEFKNYKTYDDTVSSLSDDGYVVSNDLDNYLDKREGGEISSDVKILSGNFIQTDADVDTYGLKNAFIQADTYKESYGKSSVGSRGFYVLSVVSGNKLKLSGTIDIPASAYDKLWSVSLDSDLDSQFSTISSIDGQVVTFKSDFNSDIQEKTISSESQLTALIAGNDNAFYCPTDATLGNVILNFYGQHAEGGSVHAIAQYSHAEGRATTAEGRCSHAEGGNGTTAGGLASHAEGFGTKALGNRSHSEGSLTYATMWAAHAEGSETSAFGNGSHSEGHFTIANGHYSHAEGIETSTFKSGSHAEGYMTSAFGDYSHAEGRRTLADAENAHAAGYRCEAKAFNSTAIGRYARVLSADNNAFVWQGSTKNVYYESKGPNTFCVNPVDDLSGFFIGDKNLKTIIDENTINSNELSNYLDKRTDGEVSGDVAIVNHDFKVLSGNYIQTSTPLNVHNYSNSNTFIQAENTSYGDAYTGSKGFHILSVNHTTKEVVVSGSIGYTDVNAKNYLDTTFGKCSNISSFAIKNAILVNPSIDIVNDTQLSDLKWSIAFFDSAAAQFGNLIAIEENYDGTGNTKLKFNGTLPWKTEYNTKTSSDYLNDNDNALYVVCFPEIGSKKCSYLNSQHIEGGSTKAIGKYSHAEGRDTLADGRYSHAEGTMTIAGGLAAHSEGQQNFAKGNYSHTEGRYTKTSNSAAHAEGLSSVAFGEASHAEGFSSVAEGKYSHAEGGYFNTASDYRVGGYAVGQGSHAEGAHTYAKGIYGHAEGYQTSAIGVRSHSEGAFTEAQGNTSHAAGIHSYAKHQQSWCWSGLSTNIDNMYESKGPGTFNINPQNGLSGFYVGKDNFVQCVLNVINEHKADIKAALGIT